MIEGENYTRFTSRLRHNFQILLAATQHTQPVVFLYCRLASRSYMVALFLNPRDCARLCTTPVIRNTIGPNDVVAAPMGPHYLAESRETGQGRVVVGVVVVSSCPPLPAAAAPRVMGTTESPAKPNLQQLWYLQLIYNPFSLLALGEGDGKAYSTLNANTSIICPRK